MGQTREFFSCASQGSNPDLVVFAAALPPAELALVGGFQIVDHTFQEARWVAFAVEDMT